MRRFMVNFSAPGIFAACFNSPFGISVNADEIVSRGVLSRVRLTVFHFASPSSLQISTKPGSWRNPSSAGRTLSQMRSEA
jgi:hypothetical protein